MEARHWRGGGVAVLALLGAPALAQETGAGTTGESGPPAEETSIPVETLREREGAGFDNFGVALHGGVSGYTGALGRATNVGAFLGLQADVQALRWVDVELGYEGSFHNFVGGNQSGSLWRHNLSALAKVGPVLGSLRPYVGAGFGMSNVDPTDEAEALGYDGDFITEVPLVAGLDYQLGDWMVGVRATLRLLDGADFGPADEGDLLSAGALVGARF